jgi:hypothetical protein
VIEAKALHGAGSEVVNDDIRGLDHSQQNLSSRVALQVDRTTTLVTVDGQKVGAFACDEWRPERSAVVPAGGFLDLDDVSAEIGQMHGREWT